MQRHALVVAVLASWLFGYVCASRAIAQLAGFPHSSQVAAGSSPAAELPYYDLGGFHYPVSTSVAQAQTWFDRGLAMCFAFNHEEAVRCFERALGADPGFAMAHSHVMRSCDRAASWTCILRPFPEGVERGKWMKCLEN